MNIGHICQRSVVTIRPFDDLTGAAELMREKHVGYLIVVEPALERGAFRPVGVLTDRDIVISVIARGADPSSLRVEDVMTREPTVALATESIDSVLPKMRQIGVRRVPVVGQRGELVGVLSLDDILSAIAGQLRNMAGAVRTEQVIESVLRP